MINMAFKPTEEQKRIIDARNTSLLVSAAAGSGKTAVLVERIISLVCDENNPVDIDRILVVTFTQAAAAEMKERVLKRISEKLEEDPDNEHLQKQVTLVHRAPITTIDSFCLDVIRNHFQDIGIEPDFRVVDDGEAELIRQDVISDILERAYKEKDPGFISCVESFCPGNNDSILEELILGMVSVSESYPWPDEYLLARKADHNISGKEDFARTGLESAVMRFAGGFISHALDHIEYAIRVCESIPVMENYCETFEQDREYFEELALIARNGQLDGMYEALSDYASNKKRLKSLRKAVDDEEAQIREEVSSAVKKVRDSAWKDIEKLKKKYFAITPEEHAKMIRGCREPLDALLDLCLEFRSEYAARKQKKHCVDFSDLSHHALEILTKHSYKEGGIDIEATDAAIEYRDRFLQVMCDEYQDSNLIQEIILNVISAEDIGRYDRFTVGDVKQSIYSFRQARPDLFIEKQREYESIPPRMEIDLSGNFRSRREVIDSVNRIFERIMHEETGGIEYDENAALKAKAGFAENENCKTELLIFDNKLMENAAADLADVYNDGAGEGADNTVDPAAFMDDASDKCEVEALVIASRIRELMKSTKVSDGNRENPGLRDVSYGDIVVLCRSVSGVADTFRKVFADKGIPLYAEGKNGYFKAFEVSLLLQYLRVLSNPLDDVPLYAVMHSALGGFSEDEIALIRAGRKNISLYDSLLQACGRSEDTTGAGSIGAELTEKISDFLSKMDHYRKLSTYLTIRQLLDRITVDHDYMEMCAALPAGQSRVANVSMLLVMASNFENSSFLGLNDFIRYIDNMEKFEIDSGEAGSASEGADVVRLMTIHKSKGLEFPVVFISGMGRGFNFRDIYKPMLSDDEYGIGCRYADTDRRIRMKTLRYNVISDKKRLDTISEEMRLLYVAMTRACEKLIMVGGLKKAEDTLKDRMDFYSERLSFGEFQNASMYLDLILPVIGCDEVKNVIDIRMVDADSLIMAGRSEEESQAAGVSEFALATGGDMSGADMEAYEKLKRKFSYVYPYAYLENLYAKTTVSELKMAAMAEKDEGAYDLMEHGEDEIPLPVFAGGSKNLIYDDAEESREDAKSGTVGIQISGTERGNAYHRFMQLLSWDRILMPLLDSFPGSFEEYSKALEEKSSEIRDSIVRFWDEEKAAGHISDKTHLAVAPYKIYSFLLSELSYRMWKADRNGLLKREQPFVFGIPASRLLDPDHKNTGSEALDKETLMIQGIIDAFLIEDGKVILLDYKTDSVKDMEELWTRYETQMDYYREALESLVGMQVSERHLYSFKLGEDRDFGI